MNEKTHLEIVVVYDDHHVQHVAADAGRGWQHDEQAREEIESIESGKYTPYGVTVAAICDCCGQEVESYVAALWGCVVETADATGRYKRPEDVPDAFLAEVAADVLAEARA